MRLTTEQSQTRRGPIASLAAVLMVILSPVVLSGCNSAAETEYAAAWGPETGTQIPLLEAVDQDGNTQTLETLARPNGLILVFNRSVVW